MQRRSRLARRDGRAGEIPVTSLPPPHYADRREEDDEQQKQPKPARRIVSPAGTVRPQRQRSE